jgi:hypothetical protein
MIFGGMPPVKVGKLPVVSGIGRYVFVTPTIPFKQNPEQTLFTNKVTGVIIVRRV